MKIILSHDHADFDAVASMLAAWKLNPDATPILPPQQHNSVQEFLTLYRNGLPFVRWDDFKEGASVTHITLTDTQDIPSLRKLPKNLPTYIVEHHPQEREMGENETWAGEKVGAATTILVEQIKEKEITLSTLEATLLALGIYADTGMMTYGGTTPRDMRAAAWLLEQGAVLDTVQRFLSAPLNSEQQALFQTLLHHTDDREINGYDITLCTAKVDERIDGISTVTGRLRDVVDADALIVLVQMPDNVQLVARSKVDAVHVGEIARLFEGGGHPRASAAAIDDVTVDAISTQIWDYLRDNIQPAVRVEHLMSFGVQTVEADEIISDLVPRLRRIGHEGYPVTDNGQIVGLLTLRDADKALEHGLHKSTVRDVMLAGNITLNPEDPIALLEEKMVDSGWGQIPIVNYRDDLIGIVTRTDLIKHWGNTHPTQTNDQAKISADDIQDVLGKNVLALIEKMGKLAQEADMTMYMVGGVVRDILLQRPNDDIDFVLEGNAISFATDLQTQFGGKIHTHEPFGTATWFIDETVAEALNLPYDNLPDHLDFTTARSELYEHPTALPTVYRSGIKLDLRRRDFTINALAVQLSPKSHQWRILDFYGGLADLDNQQIRVLHSLSFVDDPTRILRAIRFATRLDFTIESRTHELIKGALLMMGRITGERIRKELNLMLQEDDALKSLNYLQSYQIPQHIHTDFVLKDETIRVFEDYVADYPQWEIDVEKLVWHILFAPLQQVEKICERLLFNQQTCRAIVQTSQLIEQKKELKTGKPSQIVKLLTDATNETLIALWLWCDDAHIRQNIEKYHDIWQEITPTIDGNILKQHGLKPSPHYRTILATIRDAWLDGEVNNPIEEDALLNRLIAELDDDNP